MEHPLTALRLTVAAALVALAVLVALLAADVRSWRGTIAEGDAVLAAAPARATWTPSTRLGGLSGRLLGVGGDLELRRALQLYALAVGQRQRLDNELQVQTERAQAMDALTTEALDANGRRASQAQTALGALTFGSSSQGSGTAQIDASISDFTDAIRSDPDNALAKFDLELLFRLTLAHGVRTGQGVGGGLGHTGRRGAGGGVAGSGY
jgi:hypothetical protein